MFWWIGEGPRRAGRVELGDDALSLAATTPETELDRIQFVDVGDVSVERGLLHVGRRGEPTLHIGSLDAPGALNELAERLSRSSGVLR